MSFFQRTQPLLFSSLLALTSSSCPPQFLNGRTETDDGPLTCPVRDLPPLTDGPDGLSRALTGLAGLGVDPDSFHLENRNRLRGLAPVCSEAQINRFDGLQEALSARVAAMPADRVAQTLEDLYAQAYVFNAADRTMAAGDSQAQREAKRRLDLWIAAVDQRAYADAEFLDRVWSEKRIRAVMALNSPHLNPIDRGDQERLLRASAGGDDAIIRLNNERPMDGFVRQFDWLKTYDGRSEKYFEDPYWRSQTEAFIVQESRFDLARLMRLGRASFPREGAERLMDERGYGPSYRSFLSLTDEALIQRFHETSLGMNPLTRPATRRRLMEDMTVMGVVFSQRGLNPTEEFKRRGIVAMMNSGYSREDAELIYRLQAGGTQYTHDRLDDYRARAGLLREYRSLYTEMLTHPLEEVFSPETVGRYVMWGRIILNRSMTNVPIFLEDLDFARHEVQRRVFPTMRFTSSFEFRDPYAAQWATPSDLGLCDSLTGGPMVLAGLASFNGRSVNEQVCSNVDLIAVLPASLHHDHALATAIGVFGVITLRSLDSVSDGVSVHDADWTPGSLAEVLTHEAAHIDWFRTYFDNDSQRLTMLALNERRAYGVGLGNLEGYFVSGFAPPDESDAARERVRFITELIDTANDVIGIPAEHREPDYWEARWDAEPPYRYAFQPPDVLSGRRTRKMLDARFRAVTTEEQNREWQRYFDLAVSYLSPAERRAAREGLARITDPSNTSEAAVFFLQSDIFTRVVNAMRSSYRMPSLPFIDASADDWRAQQRSMGLYMIDVRNMRRFRR